jgi:hypothetical protein
MRFLIIPSADRSGIDARPSNASCDHRAETFDEEICGAFARYNEQLTRAGVLVAAEGVNPEAAAVRIGVRGGTRLVIDGPFAECKEIVGGFYLIDVASREEAIAWALKCPIGLGHEALELRQLTEIGDLPAEMQKLMTAQAPQWSSSRWPAAQPR